MRIVRGAATALTAALFLATCLPAESPAWQDATRDVYVDGELDRSAQVLVSEKGARTALLIPRLGEALLLDREAASFSVLPRQAFRLSADRATAEVAGEASPQPGGLFRKPDRFSSILHWKGRTVLVARHEGLVGEVSEETLFATVPVWKSLMEAYLPAEEAVSALRKIERETSLTVVVGTWCGDSKEYVPRLLKTLHAAGNPKIAWRLVALDNQFLRPEAVIQGRRVINVPTILVDRGGQELGRITETPAGEAMEQDLVAILQGRPNPHQGRYERGPEIAKGTYIYRDDAGVERGVERWTLWATDEGGRLVQSRIERDGLVTEVFQGTDASGRLEFTEITRSQGEGVLRVRYRLHEDVLTGWLRGKEAGILQQDLVVPPEFAFASPAVAANGWMALAASQGSGGATTGLVCYVAPETFQSPLGAACVVTYRVAGAESVRVPAGEFRATRFARQSATETSDWWLHPELGIPVRGQTVGGMEYVLSTLQVARKANGS